jgi:hypothetical protein
MFSEDRFFQELNQEIRDPSHSLNITAVPVSDVITYGENKTHTRTHTYVYVRTLVYVYIYIYIYIYIN